jgi:2-keto-4-pentenoate hydratase/2-oxohepta-3-ene-1,7-dioic acid hydratase in catechol pathway
MRLANIDGRASVVVGDGVIDVATATEGAYGPDLPSCIARIDELSSAMAEVQGPVTPLDRSRLGPPSPSPSQIIAIGMNYASHAEEMGLEVPAMPAAFAKFRSALSGPIGTISLPSETVDYEVELVLVIGRRTDAVTPENAWEHVAGITAGQDFSERTVQMAAGRQFALGKSYPGFAATGPWISTLDEFADPADVPLGCSIDGVTVQDARSSDMIIKIPELLTILSDIITLEPGDLLYTGCPAGVGMGKNPPTYLRPGQELVTWVEGVGEMRHTMA